MLIENIGYNFPDKFWCFDNLSNVISYIALSKKVPVLFVFVSYSFVQYKWFPGRTSCVWKYADK